MDMMLDMTMVIKRQQQKKKKQNELKWKKFSNFTV